MDRLISICVPVYNAELYIEDTLACLITQTYRNIEIIVVNDGSDDSTIEKIRHINDPRIFVYSTAKRGAAHARNTAYKNSNGEYIIFFDADDHVGPDFVRLQFEKIKDDRSAISISSWGRFYHNDPDNFKLQELKEEQILMNEWIKRYWYIAAPMTVPGRVMMHRLIADAAGPWNENLSLNDDLEYFTRVFLKADRLMLNSPAVFYYRSGIGGLSGNKTSAAYRSLYDAAQHSVNLAMTRYPDDNEVALACANLLQSLIYEIYPYEKQLVKLTETSMFHLPKSDLPFPAGGLTRLLTILVGWKLTKLLKTKLT